jgi:hypothetical protein
MSPTAKTILRSLTAVFLITVSCSWGVRKLVTPALHIDEPPAKSELSLALIIDSETRGMEYEAGKDFVFAVGEGLQWGLENALSKYFRTVTVFAELKAAEGYDLVFIPKLDKINTNFIYLTPKGDIDILVSGSLMGDDGLIWNKQFHLSETLPSPVIDNGFGEIITNICYKIAYDPVVNQMALRKSGL